MATSLPALNALNFFMADVRDGLGPFLGVYLQQQKWSPGEIGLVMTIGGLAGMLATTPLGVLVDRTKAKRAVLIFSAILIVAATAILFWLPGFGWVTASQVATGIAGAAIGPAIAGVTLGLVHQRGFAHQLGRNEAFNHGGNVFAALAAGALGYLFGLGAVFAVMTAMVVASIGATAAIKAGEIDHAAARGAAGAGEIAQKGFLAIFETPALLVLGITLLLFHLGNAAMLPLLGQSLVAQGAGDASAYTSATIIVAQLTMIPMALLAARIAEQRGYWIVFLIALLALPLRGALAAIVTGPAGLIPVQMLDGVGAGMLGVAVPGLVARILAGSGQINAGLGAVMTVQGVGAALSPTLGGYVAQLYGYEAAFAALGCVAAIGLAIWLFATPLMRVTSPQPCEAV